MVKHRLQLATPNYFHRFEIKNGSVRKNFSWWEFLPECWDTFQQLQSLGCAVGSSVKLNDVLQVVGSHATLWLGDWQGIVVPMDVPPQGWTYPSGRALEPEWWWQWHPCDRSAKKIVQALNAAPVEAWESARSIPFKSGIAFQSQRNQGNVLSVEAIPMQRLPGLVRKDVPWVFEFLQQQPRALPASGERREECERV
jgi:hypothetical protein